LVSLVAVSSVFGAFFLFGCVSDVVVLLLLFFWPCVSARVGFTLVIFCGRVVSGCRLVYPTPCCKSGLLFFCFFGVSLVLNFSERAVLPPIPFLEIDCFLLMSWLFLCPSGPEWDLSNPGPLAGIFFVPGVSFFFGDCVSLLPRILPFFDH